MAPHKRQQKGQEHGAPAEDPGYSYEEEDQYQYPDLENEAASNLMYQLDLYDHAYEEDYSSPAYGCAADSEDH
jgi:hypothetical protein